MSHASADTYGKHHLIEDEESRSPYRIKGQEDVVFLIEEKSSRYFLTGSPEFEAFFTEKPAGRGAHRSLVDTTYHIFGECYHAGQVIFSDGKFLRPNKFSPAKEFWTPILP